jgi:hypothetical protein
VLGDYLDMRIPVAFYKFIKSETPNMFTASGGFVTISKTLKKIQKKIINGALDKFIDTSEKESVIKAIHDFNQNSNAHKETPPRKKQWTEL